MYTVISSIRNKLKHASAKNRSEIKLFPSNERHRKTKHMRNRALNATLAKNYKLYMVILC